MKSTRIVIILLLGLLLVAGVSCCPAPTGENIYSEYGFSFEYPAGVHIYEEGLFSPMADEDSGRVTWGTVDEAIVLCWFKTIWDSEMAEDSIDVGIEEAEAIAEAFELIGGKVSTHMSGFDVIYQLFDITVDGEDRSGIVAVWYCEPGTTAFWGTFGVTDSALSYFEDFLYTFRCQ